MAKQASQLRAVLGGATVSAVIVSLMSVASGQGWPMGGQNIQNSRTQSDTTITPENVVTLTLKWVFTAGGNVSATPAVYDGTVYFPDFAGNFYAVNAKTGALLWSNTVSSWTGVSGDYARNDPAIAGDTLILGDQGGSQATWTAAGGLTGPGARVIAVNRLTGALIWSTQVATFPGAIITGSPVIYNGVVYVGISSNEEGLAVTNGYPCCAFRGSVVALGLQHGKILWKTFLAPSGYSGGSVWGSTPVIDVARNSVYVGTGNNYSVPEVVKTCFANNDNNPYCAASNDYFDSVVALDLTTGQVKWATQTLYYDASTNACFHEPAGQGNCPSPQGPDYDFGGSGPNMIGSNLLGIGQKSGIYWALNPDYGNVVWQTQVGPAGIMWGTAFDGASIYVPISNKGYLPYALQPGDAQVNGGSWAALNPNSGQIIWQTATPGSCSPSVSGYEQGCMALGPPSVANGVVFVGSMDVNPQNPTMFALSAASGEVLWSYIPGSSVIAAPAIASDNSVYWGSGYSRLGSSSTSNNKLFAFSIQ
jgi:polyvinyl alcohol dehydrogenase (cytochrome)